MSVGLKRFTHCALAVLIAVSLSACGSDDDNNNDNQENRNNNALYGYGANGAYGGYGPGYTGNAYGRGYYGSYWPGSSGYTRAYGRSGVGRNGLRRNSWIGYGWQDLNFGLSGMATYPSPSYSLNYGFGADLSAYTSRSRIKIRKHIRHSDKFAASGLCDEPVNFNLNSNIRVSLNEHAFQSEFAGKKLVLESADILLKTENQSGEANFLRGHFDGKKAKVLCHTAESCLNSDKKDTIRAMMKLPEVIDLKKNENINTVELKFETDGFSEKAYSDVQKKVSTHRSFLDQPQVSGVSITPRLFSVDGKKLQYISNIKMEKDGVIYDIKYMGIYKVK